MSAYSPVHIRVDHALGSNLVAHIVINQLRVVLRADAGERLALRLRDAEAIKGVLDVLGHILPVVLHPGLRADIGGDVIHVQPLDRRTPVRQGHFVVDLQSMQAELLHPHRVMLFLRQFVDDLRRQTCLHTVGIVFDVPDVVNAAVDVLDHGLLSVVSHGAPRSVLRIHGGKAALVDRLDQLRAAVFHDDAVFHDVRRVHMQRLENTGAVRDDEQRTVHALPI